MGVEFELVWESKALTRRDLTIPTAANTHATGSFNLDKGLLEDSARAAITRIEGRIEDWKAGRFPDRSDLEP